MRTLAALTLALSLATQALALDPLPDVQAGPGYSTWTIESDKPLLRLETVLHDLRFKDALNYPKVLDALGIQKEKTGRSLGWPEFIQPMRASAQFLGFERRKMAVLTLPVRGRHRWYAVILRQEGNDEAYWRARQVFVFDTDPVEGYAESFPDINGEDIHFWMVRHLSKDSIFGTARVDSIFRWDERGRLRITFQELADAYRPGRFQGEALRLQQSFVFKGDQVIRREIKMQSYPWMKREEWEQYRSVDAPKVPAAKVWTVRETFAWNPVDFNFYGAEQELLKLVKDKSPFVRREAARRLGEHLKTTHPQLEAALFKDKDAYVRIQAALALGAIGDPDALPSLQKVLKNWDEPDSLREAYEQSVAKLEAIQAGRPEPTPQPTAVPKKKKANVKAGQEPALGAVEQPKITEQK